MFKPHIAAIGVSFIFGLTFMFSKTALDTLSPVGLIANRFLIAFLCFEVLRQLKVVKIRFRKINIKVMIFVILTQPILYFLFETYGLQRTTSGEAGMMIALIPIFSTLFSAYILKEKPKAIQLFFIVLSVSGILFINIAQSPTRLEGTTLGFILLFGAVISASLYNIASRKASTFFKPVETTYFMMASGAIVFNIIYLIQLSLNNNLSTFVSVYQDISLTLSLLFLGIIASIFAFFLMNYVLTHLEAHVMSIYANIATIIAVIAGFIFLNEPIEYYHIIGGFMVILGVYGTVSNNKKRRIQLMNTPIK